MNTSQLAEQFEEYINERVDFHVKEALKRHGIVTNVAVENMATLNPKPGYDVGDYRFYTRGREGLNPHAHIEFGSEYTVLWLDEPKEKAVKERGNMSRAAFDKAWEHVCANRETFIEQYRNYYSRPDRPQQEPRQKQSKTQKKKEQAHAKEQKRRRG